MFRVILIALSSLAFTAQAWALSCAEPMPSYWPSPGSTVPAQPMIVLDTSGWNTLKTAWLQGPKRIAVDIETVGRYQILRPKTPLTVGASYTLGGEGRGRMSKGPVVFRDGKAGPARWTVAAGKAKAARWTGDIRLGARSSGFSWGQTSKQVLHPTFETSGPTLADIDLRRGDQTVRLLIPVKPGGALQLGQGLCGGTVNLAGEGEWRARIALVGPSGQRSAAREVAFDSLPGGHLR